VYGEETQASESGGTVVTEDGELREALGGGNRDSDESHQAA